MRTLPSGWRSARALSTLGRLCQGATRGGEFVIEYVGDLVPAWRTCASASSTTRWWGRAYIMKVNEEHVVALPGLATSRI